MDDVSVCLVHVSMKLFAYLRAGVGHQVAHATCRERRQGRHVFKLQQGLVDLWQ
jgi:hypothetical protein